MQYHHSSTNQDISTNYSQEFWNNYSLFLVKQGISKKYITWYVLRTKQYIAAYPDIPVKEHNKKQVEDYLNKVGRANQLKDWQFVQIVDAILLLFKSAIKSPWAKNFDWEYWKSSVTPLENNHPTVARDYEKHIEPAPLPAKECNRSPAIYG